MAKKLELYFKEIMRGRKKGAVASLIRVLLLPLSWIYGLCIGGRSYMYEKGFMRRYTPPVPLVISVGNIVVGGTGKTPVTLMLAKSFYERYKLAILTRGYRSKAEKLETPLILCEGQGPNFPASYCGDESYLFAKRLPHAHVIVGGNRKKASYLAAKAGVEVILLDDGMQHLRLVRDYDVVVIDAGDPFGQGYYLPRGFLREGIRSLGRANLIIINHIHNLELFAEVKKQLRYYSTAPIVGSCSEVIGIKDLLGNSTDVSQEKTVGMFCAIAQPDYFKRTLEKEGFQIVHEYIMADHDSMDEKKLEQFAQSSLKKGAKWLICTEKDRVKLKEHLTLSLPILWVQQELKIVTGHEEWQNFINSAEAKIK